MNIDHSNVYTSPSVEHALRPNSQSLPSQNGGQQKLDAGAEKGTYTGRSTEIFNQLQEKLVEQNEHPEKVTQIKEQIAQGIFEIDPAKIANELIWCERLLAL